MSGVADDAVESTYHGPVTLGPRGRGYLHGRDTAVGEMLWDTVVAAGWAGERASDGLGIFLGVGVVQASGPAPERDGTIRQLSGGRRRRCGPSHLGEDGLVWVRYLGRLLEPPRRGDSPYWLTERRWRNRRGVTLVEVWLSAAARDAGWLSDDDDEVVRIPEVRIELRVNRRNPRWEAYRSGLTALAGERVPISEGAEASIRSRAAGMLAADDAVAQALEVAARRGDPDPELVQHAYGSRFELTRTTGSIVCEETPSCLVVMKGCFRSRRTVQRRRRPAGPAEEIVSHPIQWLVFEAQTGSCKDSGGGSAAPDLRRLVEVVTDRGSPG